jgi:hypothetical protein
MCTWVERRRRVPTIKGEQFVIWRVVGVHDKERTQAHGDLVESDDGRLPSLVAFRN